MNATAHPFHRWSWLVLLAASGLFGSPAWAGLTGYYLGQSAYSAAEGGSWSGTVHRFDTGSGPNDWFPNSPAYAQILLSSYGHTYQVQNADLPSAWQDGQELITIPAGATSANFSIALQQNTTVEYDRTATLSIGNGGSNGNNYQSATGTIYDDDNPVYATIYAGGNYSHGGEILEGGTSGANSLTIRVLRDYDVVQGRTITYTLSGSTASGSDYSASPGLSGSVTIPQGSGYADFTITALTDSLQEGNETLNLQLTSGAYTIASGWGTATATILDDFPQVSVIRNNLTMIEGGGTASFTIYRGYYPGISPAKTVTYVVSGTATKGVDYNPNLSGTVSIPAGAGSVNITLTPLADSIAENPETATLTLGSGVYTINPSQSSATITNLDDTPQISVRVLNPYPIEGGNQIGFAVERNFLYSGNSTKVVTLSIGGTATAGTDYTNTLSTSVTIPSDKFGVTNWITPLTDTVVEGVETVSVTAQSGNYYVLATNSSATGYIYDDYPVVSVQATDSYAAEAGLNPGAFTLTRAGNTNKAITVQLNITGTAAPGVDYTALPTNVTFGIGVVQTSLTVTPIANAGIETAETVVLSIKTNAAYFLGLHTNAVVTITGENTTPQDTYPMVDRYLRGSGTNLNAYSIVIPLDGLKGTRRNDMESSGQLYTTGYHYNATNGGNQDFITNRIAFNTPIATFGRSWGTPLYLGQSYSVGFYPGFATTDPLAILVYRRSDGGLDGVINLTLPDLQNTNDWSNFATNGFARTVTNYGLTTVLRDASDMKWGTASGGWVLTHTAAEAATHYFYVMAGLGIYDEDFMTLNGAGLPSYGNFYELTFEPRPNWHSVFIDQPHFQGEPLPPDLWNKTPDELEVASEIAHSNLQCLCNFHQRIHRRGFFAPFYSTNKHCRKVRFFSQFFLAEFHFRSLCANRLA